VVAAANMVQQESAYILQGASKATMIELVKEVGGEMKHDFSVISAISANLTAEQVKALSAKNPMIRFSNKNDSKTAMNWWTTKKGKTGDQVAMNWWTTKKGKTGDQVAMNWWTTKKGKTGDQVAMNWWTTKKGKTGDQIAMNWWTTKKGKTGSESAVS
jgi:hypothetical protein